MLFLKTGEWGVNLSRCTVCVCVLYSLCVQTHTDYYLEHISYAKHDVPFKNLYTLLFQPFLFFHVIQRMARKLPQCLFCTIPFKAAGMEKLIYGHIFKRKLLGLALKFSWHLKACYFLGVHAIHWCVKRDMLCVWVCVDVYLSIWLSLFVCLFMWALQTSRCG